MVAIGIPGMIDGFQTDASLIVWVNLAFFMGNTAPLLPLARVADAFGRKRMYLWGSLIVSGGLAFSAVSQDVTQLIVARVVTAVGAAMIVANDNALLTQAFPASERGRAQGFINMAFGLGIGLGFLLGGVLVDHLGWRALFWSRIPAQLILVILVWRFIRDDPAGSFGPRNAYRVDYAGVVLLTVVMVSGLLAINQAGKIGFESPIVVVAICFTALAVPILILVERRAAFPVFQLQLFSSRVFSSGVGSQLIVQISHGGWNFLAPFLLITGMGHSATFAGLMILPFHIIRLVMSPLSGVISDKIGTGVPSLVGHLALLGGLIALTRLGADASIWQQMVAITIGGVGLSIFLPANNSAIMGFVPQDSLSSASGFLASSRSIGTSVGVALAAAVYADRIGPGVAKVSGVASAAAVSAVGDALIVVCAVSAIGILAIALRGRG